MRDSFRAFAASLILAHFLTAAAADPPQIYSFHYENVLGTSFELRVRATSEAVAKAAEHAALAEIDRLSALVSTYDPKSELSLWLASFGTPVKVSPELFELLEKSDHWSEKSQGAFSPGVQVLTRLWKQAAAKNMLPDAAEIASARSQFASRLWTLDGRNKTATRLGNCPVTLDAIAKGWIVGRVCDRICEPGQGVFGVLLNLGGDLSVRGNTVEIAAIADPLEDAENAAPLCQVALRNVSLATSGNYRRGFRVRDQWYSHILDPRSGRPVDHVLSASVIAADAAEADALATTFCVLKPKESLELAQALPGVECLLITAGGQTMHSAGWSNYEVPGSRAMTVSVLGTSPDLPETAANPSQRDRIDELELLLSFEINRPDGGRYTRPYIAVWLEDKDNFPVRTLTLWYQQGKGQRWLPDLRRWHRSDQMRRLVDEADLAYTISSATRQPGKYSVVWDGKDDHKKLLKPGTYTLYLEAAREHGTYQLIRKEVTIGGQPFRAELGGNIEIKSASLEYRPRSAAQ